MWSAHGWLSGQESSKAVVVIDLADLVLKRAWVFVPWKDHIWVLEQLMPDHVAQGVVLLVQSEDGRVGHLRVLLSRDLLLPIKENERLKGGRSVHHWELGGRSATEIAGGSSWKVLDRLSRSYPMLLSATFLAVRQQQRIEGRICRLCLCSVWIWRYNICKYHKMDNIQKLGYRMQVKRCWILETLCTFLEII